MTQCLERKSNSLRYPEGRTGSSWKAEDLELTRAIWLNLFRLDDMDVAALYCGDYSDIWKKLTNVQKPDWWTGDRADARHDLYLQPIWRFFDDCYRERSILKWYETRCARVCTDAEFDEKWRNGHYYDAYNQWR